MSGRTWQVKAAVMACMVLAGTAAAWSWGFLEEALGGAQTHSADRVPPAGIDRAMGSAPVSDMTPATTVSAAPAPSPQDLSVDDDNGLPGVEVDPPQWQVDEALDALATTCTSNLPNNPGDPPPGVWWNPKRWGTGWTFAYEPGTQRMMVVWHTFYPQVGGGQTWLVSDWAKVLPQSDGKRSWTATLYRTRYGNFGGRPVGKATLAFPSDSATRAALEWEWVDNSTDPSSERINARGSECIYSFYLDGPAQALGPSLAEPTGESSQTIDYTGIWFDPSTPGFALELAQGKPANGPYNELHTVSIYDTDKKPVWLWAQLSSATGWPTPSWLQTDLGYRTAKYNMATTDCSDKAPCVNETMFMTPTHVFGRQFHDAFNAVVGVKVSSTASSTTPSLAWPPTGWPAPTGNLSGCPSGLGSSCRPIYKQTDTESISVTQTWCDPKPPSNTCQINVSWTGSPLAVVTRIDPDTGALVPRNGDGGQIGGGITGSSSETLSADERLLYRLSMGERKVRDIGVRAAYSKISATPNPCVINVDDDKCNVTVTWSTPDPVTGNNITIYRYERPISGGTLVKTSIKFGVATGSTVDTVGRGKSVYYEVYRLSTWLASTSGNPIEPVDSSITATPTTCSVPVGASDCPITVTWLTGYPQAQIKRVDLTGGSNNATVASGTSGSATDRLPAGSHVNYTVSVGSAVQATSADVSAITSLLTTNASRCVVPAGQSTCAIRVSWTSTPAAQVYRVDEVGSGRNQIGADFTGSVDDPLTAGARVHYELTIGGVLHATTPAVVAVNDSEGGDSGDGAAEPVPQPAAFVEPALDTDSDRVGAIVGGFRVDESGNATYRIPLALPPGAGGLAPTLALSYNSGGGEGYLGTGFTLEGMSAITPCRPSAEAGDSGLSADPSEFCLDGQRLLLVNGTHRAVNAEYRTEIETFQRIKLVRIETPVVDGKASPAYVFTVEGKDGGARTFGGALGTVFGAIPGTSNVIVQQAWLQTDLKDVAGNTINFDYNSVASLGERYLTQVRYTGGSIVPSYVDSRRTDVAYSALGMHTQSKRLSGIEVKGAQGTTLRYYEPTYDLTSTAWAPFRPHLVSLRECDRQGGVCYPATTFTWSEPSEQVEEFNGSMGRGLGYYQFGDLDGDKRADLWWTSNASAGGRNNQLHVSGVTTDAQGKPTLREIYTNDRLLPDAFANGGLWEVLDFNGDGRDDLLFAYPNRDGAACGGNAHCPNQLSWVLRRSTGNGLGPEEVVLTVPLDALRAQDGSEIGETSGGGLGVDPDGGQEGTQDPAGPPKDPPPGSIESPEDIRYLGSSMVADVDGDGLPDLIFRAPDGKFWVALTRRTNNAQSPFAFTAVQAVFLDETGNPVTGRCGFASAQLTREEETHSQAMDFDGDGRADLRFLVDAGGCGSPGKYRLDVFLSKGQRTSDGTLVFQAARPFGDVLVKGSSPTAAAQRLRTVDVNGDGLVDLVYANDNDIWNYRLGGPGGIGGCVVDCTLRSNGDGVQLLDFDGDGKLDFWIRNGSSYDIYQWAGNRWVKTDWGGAITSAFHFPNPTDWTRITADFDGDGMADNFFVRPSDGTWHLQRTVNHHRPRGVITQIVNGLGAKTTIDYAPLTFSSVYKRDYNAPLMLSGRGSAVFDVAVPNYVVRSVRSSAPIQSNPNAESSVTYRYAGLKIQAGGRGSLGFRRISTTDNQTGIEVDTYYSQRFPYTGLAEYTETRRPGAALDFSACSSSAPDYCFAYTPLCAGGIGKTCDGDLPDIGNTAKTIKSTLDRWQWRTRAGVGALKPDCGDSGTTGLVDEPGSGESGDVCIGSGLPPIYPDELDRRVLAAAQAPIFLARVESLTSNYDLVRGIPGGALSSEAASFPLQNYDAYGNPGLGRTSKAGGSTTVDTDSVFDYDNTEASWRLGRLKTATVQTTRTMDGTVDTNVRRSTFTYDAKGLLTSEKVEGMTGSYPSGVVADATAPAVATYYDYDSFGNKQKTWTCSTGIAEANCRALSASGGGGYKFHPTDAATVMRYSKVSYDSLGRFADTTSEAFSAGGDLASERSSSWVASRNAAGDPLEVSDANGSQAKYRYGVLGRQRYTYANTGASTLWEARYCSGMAAGSGVATTPCPGGMGLAYRATTTTAGAPTGHVFYDVLGRPALTLTQGFDAGTWLATAVQYDARGNVKRQYDPVRVVDANAGAATPIRGVVQNWTETTYDELNRPTKIVHTGDNVTTTIAYDGLKTVTTLPANGSALVQTVTELKNGLGEVVKTIDANGFEVATRYGASGNPVRVSRGAQVTTMTYDRLGRKTGMSDPDASPGGGSWTYVVNGAGETIKQVSPRGTCTTSDLDGRGRLWRRRDYANAACTTLDSESSWSFDTASYGVGALAQERNGLVTRTPSYDDRGRLKSMDTDLDGKRYTEEWTFDEYGRPFQSFFGAPGMPKTGERTVYSADGFPTQVRSAYPKNGAFAVYREIQTMNARGQVTKERSAAGKEYTLEREYDVNNGRLTRLLAQSTSAGLLQDVMYTYDDLGNVMSRTDRNGLRSVTENFAYDRLQRLLSGTVMSAGQTTFVRSQNYDADGNITTKSDVGGGMAWQYGTRPSECGASAFPGPHAASNAGGAKLCYDANGNVVKKVAGTRTTTYAYTAADQASDLRDTANNRRIGFGYGPNRERVRRADYLGVDAVGADTLTHWIGGAEIRYQANAANGPGVMQEVRRYVGNVLVVQSGSGGTYSLKRQILLTDAQGSTHQVLGAMTLQPVNASSPTSFDAWGQRREGASWGASSPWSGQLEAQLQGTTHHGYTGHEMAEPAGVIHMNGRIYDPALGRFLQADPMVQSPGNAQNWNRYTYVFNNPLAYTDPTGYWGARERQWVKTVAAVIITVYSGGTAAGAAWGFFGSSVTAGQAFGAIVIGGFASGAVQTGTLKGAVTGAVSAAAFYGVGSAFTAGNGASWMFDGKDLSFAGYAAKTLSQGAVGGVMAELQGGRFGHGFASAGFSTALSPAIDGIKSTPAQMVAATVAGGTASVLAGGKFANGAITAAFQYSFTRAAAKVAENRAMEKAAYGNPKYWMADSVLFNDPLSAQLVSGVYAGHVAVAIGSNDSGWYFYSSDGESKYIAAYFDTYADMSYSDVTQRYSRALYMLGVSAHDAAMQAYANSNFGRTYSGLNYNCADYAFGTLGAVWGASVDHTSSYLSVSIPNWRYEALRDNSGLGREFNPRGKPPY